MELDYREMFLILIFHQKRININFKDLNREAAIFFFFSGQSTNRGGGLGVVP